MIFLTPRPPFCGGCFFGGIMRILCFVVLFCCLFGGAFACDVGYYMNDLNECEICPAGYYCNDGVIKTACPTSDYCNISPDAVMDGYGALTWPTGATTPGECMPILAPGYAIATEDGNRVQECAQNSYCAGGVITMYPAAEHCSRFVGDTAVGQTSCGFGYTHTTGATSAQDCIMCPDLPTETYGAHIMLGMLDSSSNACTAVWGFAPDRDAMQSIGVFILMVLFSANSTIIEVPNSMPATGYSLHGDFFVMATYNSKTGRYDTNVSAGGIGCADGYHINPKAMMSGDLSVTGATFNSLSDALDGVCVRSDEPLIPDGTVCFAIDGAVECVPCSDIHPSFMYSDGTRTMPENCYAMPAPGYYMTADWDAWEIQELPCVGGDYCPGNIPVHFSEPGGGNIPCSMVSDVHIMSDPGAASVNMCYATCDTGNVVNYPVKCDGSYADCLDGFLMHNGRCDKLCDAGITRIKTSTGLSVPLFADKHTAPALHIGYNGRTCYADLHSGHMSNAINVNYSGVIYHTDTYSQ